MNVIVTGATGYIGRHLCKKLLDKGFDVTVLVRSHDNVGIHTESFRLFEKTIAGFKTKPRIIKCDIDDHSNLRENFEKLGPIDCVFHLAGQTLSRDLVEPHLYFQSNFIATLNILENCRIFKIKKLIFSSSIAVYGLSEGQHVPKYMPVDELHEAKPFDFYGISKFQAEQLCRHYHDRSGLRVVILRYSRVYGPDMKRGFVYQSISNALAGKILEVFGDISTDFVFIDDIVDANILSLEKAIPEFEIFNIGSGKEVTLYDLCSKIIKLTNSSSKIKILERARSKFILDISKARKMLSFCTTELEQGITKCVKNTE